MIYLEGILDGLGDRLWVVEMFLQLDQDVRNKFRHVVGEGLDESAEAEDAGVKVGQLQLVFRLGSLLK
jgi:hypothetical protein